MILPTKTIKPVDSLFCISSYVMDIISGEKMHFDELLAKLNDVYPTVITVETLILSLNMLFLIGKIELNNETITVKF